MNRKYCNNTKSHDMLAGISNFGNESNWGKLNYSFIVRFRLLSWDHLQDPLCSVNFELSHSLFWRNVKIFIFNDLLRLKSRWKYYVVNIPCDDVDFWHRKKCYVWQFYSRQDKSHIMRTRNWLVGQLLWVFFVCDHLTLF